MKILCVFLGHKHKNRQKTSRGVDVVVKTNYCQRCGKRGLNP